MSGIINTAQLTKSYGVSRGIIDVTFSVAEGEIFGFLGPNGAGKTTAIRTLMGFMQPTSGTATIDGRDCWAQSTAVKRIVGYLPGEFSMDPNLTGAQIIAYLGNLRGGVDQAYVTQLAERLEFDPHKRFREYSRGNKQKIGIIQALMHRPKLLILDEPTGGLDPLNQQEFYRLVKEVKHDGRTIFMSSHILPEVEHICDRVGIIRDGQLVRIDRVEDLKDIKHHIVEITFPAPASADWFNGIVMTSPIEVSNGGRTLTFTVAGDLQQIIPIAGMHGATNFITHEPSLEEVFLRFYTADPAPTH